MVFCKSRKNELLQLYKVIIARSSKDPQSIEWWKNKAEGKSTGTILPTPQLSKFSNMVSAPKRYDFYQTTMHRYPKMYIPYKKFCSKLSKLQNYLTNHKYWKNANINGEKQQFLHRFSLDSWSLLSERRKKFAFSTRLCKVWGNQSIIFIYAQICKWKDRKYNVQS